MRLILWVSLLFAIFISATTCALFWPTWQGHPITVAVAMPLDPSAPGSEGGHAALQAVQLYADEVNAKGGIEGRRLVVEAYDDGNDSERAADEAVKIAESNAVAVIGHMWSSCSMAAGQEYQRGGIAAITPASTNTKVTVNNPWYFRNIFNDDSQGAFLANYSKQFFGARRVVVIEEDLAYGANLAAVFKQTARDIGLELVPARVGDWSFTARADDQPAVFARFIEQIAGSEEPIADAIFLAMHDYDGEHFVRQLRLAGLEIPVIAPDSFAKLSFPERFADDPIERQQPGFYTNGLVVTTPFIFDVANKQAQEFRADYLRRYHQEPEWIAAFAYDAVKLIHRSLADLDHKGQPIAELRRALRDRLQGFDSLGASLEGVTGINYFDADGDAQKPVVVGQFEQRRIISALNQLTPIKSLQGLDHLPELLANRTVVRLGDAYMYNTNVVYAGLRINELHEVDLDEGAFQADFHLWFRYHANLDLVPEHDLSVDHIVFGNALDAVEMVEGPAAELRQMTDNNMVYRRFHLRGTFRADFIQRQQPLGRHDLDISLHHRHRTQDNLVFVPDFLGMDADEMGNQHLVVGSGWQVGKLLSFQGRLIRSSLGDLNAIRRDDGQLRYSRFVSSLQINQRPRTIRRAFSMMIAQVLVGVALALAVLALLRRKRLPVNRLAWTHITAIWALLLLGGEVLIVNFLTRYLNAAQLESIVVGFSIAWWLLIAQRLQSAMNCFVWDPLGRYLRHEIPQLIRGMSAGIILALAVFGIIGFVFKQPLTSLLATSGLFAMIIGLAIQVNISNVFSGIAINLERPFRHGDWISVGELNEGKVVDITWRTTRVKDRFGNIISIPNSMVSESVVTNFNYPDNVYEQYFFIDIEVVHDPEKVIAVLKKAVSAVDLVLDEPAVSVSFRGFTGWSARYIVLYDCNDYSKKNAIKGPIWLSIHRHLDKAGIKPAITKQQVFLQHQGQGSNEPATDKVLVEV